MIQHFWNTQKESLPGGRTRYDVRGKWTGYMPTSSTWSPIDTTIQADRTVTEVPYEVQFPLTSQGDCIINANSRFSMKRHIDEKNGSNSEPALDLTVQALAQTNVTGHADPNNPERWLYPGAWPGTTLRYGIWHGRAPRIEKVLEIDPNQVRGSLQYQFLLKTSPGNEYFTGPKNGARRPPWTGNLRAVPTDTEADGIFIAKGNSAWRGVTLKASVAWYFEAGVEVRVPITLRSRKMSPGVVEVTKLIPVTVVNAARQAGSLLFADATFYPDPDPETSTFDGRCFQFNNEGTWSDLRNVAICSSTTTNDAMVSLIVVQSDSGTDTWERMIRWAFLFDTSSLFGYVASAVFSFSSSGCSANYSPDTDIRLYSVSPNSNTDLITSDWATFSDTAISDTQAQPIGSGYKHWTLTDLTKVDINGITKLGMRSVADATDTPPTWQASTNDLWTSMIFSETSGTTSDPKLEATTNPSGPFPHFIRRTKSLSSFQGQVL